MTLKHAIMQFNITMFSYLTIILRGRAGYELINNQRGAQRRVGYDYSYPASPSRIIVLLKTGLRTEDFSAILKVCKTILLKSMVLALTIYGHSRVI